MARPRKTDGDKDFGGVELATPPVVDVKSDSDSSIKVGDMVIYNHRPMTGNPDAPDFTPLPMVVTAIHDGEISGVIFSENALFAPRGAKSVSYIKKGKGAGEWHPRP